MIPMDIHPELANQHTLGKTTPDVDSLFRPNGELMFQAYP